MYTIGHGAKKEADFVQQLQKWGIAYLIDVRSRPYSRFHPQFNRTKLENTLKLAGIQYWFMGEELGGRPKDSRFYDPEGTVQYQAISKSEGYNTAIEWLVAKEKAGLKIALMCSESNPSQCHRSKLIGETLVSRGIKLNHICEPGRLKTQSEVMCECRKGLPAVDLFGNVLEYASVKQYSAR